MSLVPGTTPPRGARDRVGGRGPCGETNESQESAGAGNLWAIGYDDLERARQAKEELTRLGWREHYLILSDVVIQHSRAWWKGAEDERRCGTGKADPDHAGGVPGGRMTTSSSMNRVHAELLDLVV